MTTELSPLLSTLLLLLVSLQGLICEELLRKIPGTEQNGESPIADPYRGVRSENTLEQERLSLVSIMAELRKLDELKDQMASQNSMMKTMMRVFSNQLTTQTNMIATLSQDNTDMKIEIAAHTNTISDLTRQISELTDRDVTNQMTTLTNVVSDLTEVNKEMTNMISNLTRDNKAMTKQIYEPQDKGMTEKMTSLVNVVTDLTRANKEMSKIIPKLTKDNKEIVKMISTLSKSNNDINSLVLEMTDRDMTSQMTDLTEVVSNLTKDNQEITEMISILSEDNIDLKNQLTNQTDLISELFEDNKDIKYQIARQFNMMAFLSHDNRDLRILMTNQTGLISKLSEDNSYIHVVITTQTDFLSELSADNKDINHKMADQAHLISKLYKSYDDIIDQINTQSLMTRQITEDHKYMTNQMTNQTSLISQLAVDHTLATNQTTFQTNLISRLSEDNTFLTKQVTTLTSKLEELVDHSKKIDELHSAVVPSTCSDVTDSDPRPVIILNNDIKVVCDTETDNGGWIMFQRRSSAKVNFNRSWEDYKSGFGSLKGNFWLGLDKIHRLTKERQYELRVDVRYKGRKYYANYKNFSVGTEQEKYRLLVSGFSGDAGDSLKYHNGMAFTTKDRDNDDWPNHCSDFRGGAWWYNACAYSNLNGQWGASTLKGMTWRFVTGSGSSVSFSELKMRPL